MISDVNSSTSLNYSLNQFCKDIANGKYYVLSINLQENGNIIAALQLELHNFKDKSNSVMSNKSIENFIEKQNFKFEGRSWARFNIMLVSFLGFCRDVNPWSIWDSCDLIFQFYQDFNNCLINDSYPLDPLVPIFRNMTEYVLPIASKLDANCLRIGTKKNQFLSFASSVISKLFNSVKPSRTNDGNVIQSGDLIDFPQKQKILLYLVNKLNNIYFRIDSPQLCFNVFKNFKPKSMITEFGVYPIKEQIEYKYLLGRYYLLNGRVINAFVQLNDAYTRLRNLCDKCNLYGHDQVRRNLLRILRYLIPTGLMIGKLPKFEMITQIDVSLSDKYANLSQTLKTGNVKGLNIWLKSHERELCERHLLVIQLEKLPMICYRNLVRSIVRQCIIPQNSGKIPYSTVHDALKISIGDPSNDSDEHFDIYNGIHRSRNVENVLVTLINLGFLRGNCFPQLKLCVVKKTALIQEVLPSIEGRILSSFALNDDDSWLND
ncbi:hypothetical protein HG535_0C02970 [Zygotorulaspora mrakii]|uniref:Uncharacterized protein n=1 Tax=Zygotorulaspora mrakii TaxID=42260 RepID=A0A7H9AZS0_ZYGMR|nr:uncharacterized protein HG535_0C02970 [Zygotorulaspora mrakii]QLG71945.1 hypothetical protein HG535_0C02970 [Zygotorulaspora mrakii]